MRIALLLGLLLVFVACTAEAAEPVTPETQAPLSSSAADRFCAALLSEPLTRNYRTTDRWALPAYLGPIVVACLDFANGE